ncbi:hypothetical protein J5U18_08870 [Sphingobacteriaceae bacterium WQ 2009]|uniref:Uncharacterized protein n=1 Tax=Rhinopithecimicrobium faecis TaxID=2820698 RepID=A0A8T4H9F8_9SPHI|nr:hypothetical protein [Sphingobacteriaceae bacterium WQ 2009]
MNFAEHIKELATLIARVMSINEQALTDELITELFQTEQLVETRIKTIETDLLPSATAEETHLFTILKTQFLDLVDFKG